MLETPAATYREQQAHPDAPARRTSAAARQNPAVRAYFKERYSPLANPENRDRVENPAFSDKTSDKAIDNMIDMHTEKVLGMVASMHSQRDKVQAAFTPALVAFLGPAGESPQVPKRPPAAPPPESKVATGALKKISELAGNLDSELTFVRFALDVALEYKLEKPGPDRRSELRRDLTEIVSSVLTLENAVEEFYFPTSSAVSLASLKEGSIPYLLQKIQKLSGRSHEILAAIAAGTEPRK